MTDITRVPEGGHEVATPARDRVKVKKGANVMLLKIDNGGKLKLGK